MDQRRSGQGSLAITMKKLDVPQSGKLGTTVSFKTRYGQITRQHVVPRDPHTAVQMSRRAAFGRARYRWGRLTDAQREVWNGTSRGSRTRPRLNQSGPFPGYLLFIKINCNLAVVGLDMVQDPPDVPEFGSNPVGKLTITNSSGVIALKLSVSGKAAQDIVVSGSRPRSPGRTREDHLAILGLLDGPERGVSDITALYVGKYGLPPVGSRVFIETMQQLYGWQDLPKLTSAVVPAA